MKYNLHDLPNEILLQILNPFDTRALLHLAPTSLRFSSVILRILHHRLLLATSLPPTYKLILEAYHPALKYSEPYRFCTYIGTPGLSPSPSPSRDVEGYLEEGLTEGERYARLAQLYSRFRPERPGVEGGISKRVDPTGGNVAQNDTDVSLSLEPFYTTDGDGEDQNVEHVINLDSHELFGQFCAIANLVKVGPRRGVFLSVVNVEDKVMRVWREWLEAQARASRQKDGGKEKRNKEDPDAAVAGDLDPSSILWTNENRNVGLLVKIRDRKSRVPIGPIIISADEEQPVSYSIEINGMYPNPNHHPHPLSHFMSSSLNPVFILSTEPPNNPFPPKNPFPLPSPRKFPRLMHMVELGEEIRTRCANHTSHARGRAVA